MVEETGLEGEGAFVAGPPCPRCGVPMEPGYLATEVRAEYTLSRSFLWRDTGDSEDTPGAKVADLWTSTHGAGPWMKGYRCRDCEVVEVRYGKGALGPAGWQIGPSSRP
ncbi:MAG: PF20097 family protein [Thermoplasmata archaeon]|nr:PF20097 family protein [Thermoplasmata archaeon]MCI4356981.1 PF20097 family protein [Thermoplasmata archaeon]